MDNATEWITVVWSWYGLFPFFSDLSLGLSDGQIMSLLRPCMIAWRKDIILRARSNRTSRRDPEMSYGVRRKQVQESTGRAGIAMADALFVSCLRQKFSRAVSTKSGRHVAPGSQRSSQQNLWAECYSMCLFTRMRLKSAAPAFFHDKRGLFEWLLCCDSVDLPMLPREVFEETDIQIWEMPHDTEAGQTLNHAQPIFQVLLSQVAWSVSSSYILLYIVLPSPL